MKLHVGSGRVRYSGWVNLDADPRVVPDICDSAEYMSKVSDGSCSHIYACHVLEHFSHRKIKNILRLWGRKMRPGGRLWISVPDLDVMCKLHIDHIGHDPPGFPWNRLFYGGQGDKYDYHKCGFNYDLLKYLLDMSGFSDIKKLSGIPIPNCQDYSSYCIAGTPISLNVESIKPK